VCNGYPYGGALLCRTGVVVIGSNRRMTVTRQCEWAMSKGDDGKQGQPLRIGVSEYSFAASVNQHSK